MMQRTIFVACDHAAFEMKQLVLSYLKSKNITCEDLGTHSVERCDYPDYAFELSKKVLATENSLGILICGSGIGISIAANKVRGIRCGICHDHYTAQMARERDGCNVLSFGARVIGFETAKEMLDVFLTREPSEEARKRVAMVREFEEESYK